MICSPIVESLKDSNYSFYNINKRINHYLYNKYSKKEYSFQHICIDNLMCNDNCHLVAKFKDYLIYDDDSEFLHEFCCKSELKSRLKNIFNFYSTYVHIFPNYLVIPEKKYIYKNLRKKQKVIDENNDLKKKKLDIKENDANDISNENKNNLDDCINKNDLIDKSEISNNKNITNSIEFNKDSFYSKSQTNCIKGLNLELSINTNYFLTERNNMKLNLKKHIYAINNDNNNKNTQYSSIFGMNCDDESKKSKSSITEIINLLTASDKSKNNNTKKSNENNKNKNDKVVYKLTNINKNRVKFFRLGNTDDNKKTFKTHKIKSTFMKDEIDKISTLKKEARNIYKKNYLKNYNQKMNFKLVDKNKIFHKQTISCLEDVSKILKKKSQSKEIKKRLSSSKNRKKNLNKNRTNNYYQSLALNTISNYTKTNKLNEIKNNLKNNIKNIFAKKNIKLKKVNNFILSTNSTINIDNNYKPSTNKNNYEYFMQNTDYQIFNTSKNKQKKNINYKLMKIIKTPGFSLAEEKSKTKKTKESNKLKLESDSILSTQVSLNKKYRHNSTFTENILTQIKKTLMKNNNNIYNIDKKCNKNTLSFSKQYVNYIRPKNFDFHDKINSYGVKPFTQHYQKIYNSTTHKRQENNSSLRKNRIISNFFDSKDFYNLRINSIKNKKSKRLENKKNVSINQFKDKNNKTFSLLKSFNKNIFHIKNFEIINKNNKERIINRCNRLEKIKNDNYFQKTISKEKIDNNNTFNKTHKKYNTTNIGKIIEDIEKKLHKTKNINDKTNKYIFNKIKNKNNRNNNKYKISSKTLTKTLKIRIDNKPNNKLFKN